MLPRRWRLVDPPQYSLWVMLILLLRATDRVVGSCAAAAAAAANLALGAAGLVAIVRLPRRLLEEPAQQSLRDMLVLVLVLLLLGGMDLCVGGTPPVILPRRLEDPTQCSCSLCVMLMLLLLATDRLIARSGATI